MAAAVDTDIDAFIREQKQKLASERQALHRYQGVKSRPDSDSLYREEWAKKHPESNGVEHPAAEVTPRRTKSKLEGGISSPDYRQRWQEVHGKQSPEKRSRRKWDVPEHPFSESVLLRDVHADHQTLQQPRRPDNSTLREFRQEGKRSHRETAEEIASLPFGEHEDKRKALAAERRQDYSEMLKKDDERRQRDRLENSFGLMGLDDHQQPPPSRRRSDILPTDEHGEMKRPRADSMTGRRAKVDSIADLLRWDSGASGFGRTNADMAIEALRDERRRDYLLQQEQEDRKRRQKMQQREAQRQQEQETLAFLSGSRQQKQPETELLGFQNDNRQQRQAEKETLAFPNGDRQPKWSEDREHEYYQMLAGKSREERRLEEETLPHARLGGRTSLVADLREQLQEPEGRQESSNGPDVQHNFRFSREKDSVPTSSEENLFSRLGSHESERRRLQEERQREYKAMLQEKDQQRQDSLNRNVLPETVREPVVRPSSALLRLRRREERNREYNMMLDEKLKQKGARNYGSIFNESYEDNFLSGLGAQNIQRK